MKLRNIKKKYVKEVADYLVPQYLATKEWENAKTVQKLVSKQDLKPKESK